MDAKKKSIDARKATNDGFSTDQAKQERSTRTRQKLISAARKIFARDGFDATRLQDIAALAGKTRGAFYAHFKDKEDVFFAIFEEDVRRDKKRLVSHLKPNPSDEEWVDAMADHLLSILSNKHRMLLHLEFKLYVLRHPSHRERLVDLHTALCLSAGKSFEEFIPRVTKLNHQKTRLEVAQFSSVIDGFGLNSMYYPGTMKDELLIDRLKIAIRTILRP
ncbi:TetR/AcrR family transcriptional regulator [Silvibacterium acidisoli]|uniref:TetR/AcrR family transcriptional regulator n=1 Tax=Acidobacteriaceae bacterium ZG23-2 TaxID=2883246 RepID=UPI00406C92DE